MLIQNRKQGFYFILTVSIAHTKSLYPKLWALMDLWFTTHIKNNFFARTAAYTFSSAASVYNKVYILELVIFRMYIIMRWNLFKVG